MALSRRPFYLDGSKGKLFCNLFEPAGDIESAVLVLSPFAEEMNKSRRMLSQQSSLLAQNGIATLLFDYYGTGDSEGDFSNATWEVWENDTQAAFDWLLNTGYKTINLLAMRMGALLINPLVASSDENIGKIVFWQPLLNGELLLNQFYRLKVASDLISSGSASSVVKNIKAELSSGHPVEIAGYTINPELVTGLENAQLEPSNFQSHHDIVWCEIVASADRQTPSVSRRNIEKLQKQGINVQSHLITGPQFWNTVELVDVPELHEKTLMALTTS